MNRPVGERSVKDVAIYWIKTTKKKRQLPKSRGLQPLPWPAGVCGSAIPGLPLAGGAHPRAAIGQAPHHQCLIGAWTGAATISQHLPPPTPAGAVGGPRIWWQYLAFIGQIFGLHRATIWSIFGPICIYSVQFHRCTQ